MKMGFSFSKVSPICLTLAMVTKRRSCFLGKWRVNLISDVNLYCKYKKLPNCYTSINDALLFVHFSMYFPTPYRDVNVKFKKFQWFDSYHFGKYIRFLHNFCRRRKFLIASFISISVLCCNYDFFDLKLDFGIIAWLFIIMTSWKAISEI